MDTKTKKALGYISKLRPWILGEDGRTPVRTDFAGYMEWAERRGGLSVRVALDEVGDAEVSTVFFDQMSMAGDPNREPQLFETLVTYPEGKAAVERRYRTWEEAERGHAEMVDELRPSPKGKAGPKP
jgi:hypothetical protein